MSQSKQTKRKSYPQIRLCISLDEQSYAMLQQVQSGNLSSYLRQLIAQEFGKKLGREDAAKREAAMAGVNTAA